MTENNELKSVLSELKKVLSDLKKEEITGKSEQQSQPQIESQPQPKLSENLSEKPKSVPIIKKPVQRPIPVQSKHQVFQSQPVIQSEQIHKSESKQPISKPESSDLEQKIAFQDTSSTFAEKEQAMKSVEVKSAKEEPTGISEESLLRYAYLCPFGQENSKDIFVSNLAEIIKRTSKRELIPYCVFEESINPVSANWNEIIKKFQEKKISAVFLVYSQDFDYTEIKNKFNSAGIFFHGILLSQLNKKITYIDLAVELILSKK